jgi:GTPase
VSLKPLRDGSVRVEQDIAVPNSSARKIVVGSQGAAIGQIGKAARLELESMWNKRVHLILNCRVENE